MIFMTHPIHGATNAMAGEVEALKAQGWQVSTHEKWLGAKLTKAHVMEAELSTAMKHKHKRR
jgi:hypothetical protein